MTRLERTSNPVVSPQKIIDQLQSTTLIFMTTYVPQIFLDEAAAGVAIAAVGQLALPLTCVHDGLGHGPALEPGLACT